MELQVWMYDGSTLSNVALSPTGSINTSESVNEYSSDTRGHGLINDNSLINLDDTDSNEGFISKTGTEIGDEVVLDFSSTQNLSQLASIVFFSHFMNYYGKTIFYWSYSSPGCSIQIYNDDTEIFSYELKSQNSHTA